MTLQDEAFYRRLIASLPGHAVCRIDGEGRLRDWSDPTGEATGFAAPALEGAPFATLFEPAAQRGGVPARLLHRARMQTETGTSGLETELRFRRPDGARVAVQAAIRALPGQDELGALFRLIDPLVEAQHLQARRMAVLGRLTAGMIHDFNNHLTAIISAAQLAQRRKTPEQTAPLIQMMHDTALRGSKLTRQLLNFGRRDAGGPAPAEIGEVLEDCLAFLRPSLGKDATIELSMSGPVRPAAIEPDEMQLALLETAYALEALMPDGGTLRLGAWDCAESPDGFSGPAVAVSLAATGIDMSEDVALPQIAAERLGGLATRRRTAPGAVEMTLFLPAEAT
ncbi:histidine kinase dimerization/phospho-acceptor domain-containing protein [Oceanibaculum pacificum]|uniref:histidine kinase n=1 Tax=Oceanibaculum pacificum TaxID=580166 RepID=A0A154W2B8_9PROT|nr:histidine kinase dimerization/phospho-acceptor domain-containing protein [Oceanibaculum pacificum]KZD07609.1 hypothetical protein AUP43_09985 [Oceanibaculum pacificum]